MMADATPEQLDLARKIASERPGLNALQRQAILDGHWDDIDGIRCALAAIIETSERAIKLSEWPKEAPISNEFARGMAINVTALRNQEHLKND